MDVRAQQKKHWDAVAGGWAAWFDWTARNFSPVTEWFRESAGWEPGARVLDVACGSGYPALAAATYVRPGGTVVATDISPEMVAVAAQRAKADGLDNVQFIEMDAEQLQFSDASFDAVTNAYGLMFCPDPARALAEIRRVLRPGGRMALAVWDDPSKSSFFSAIAGAAPSFLSLQAPDPAITGPFRFAAPGHLETLVRDAEFSDVRIERLSATFDLASADEYFCVFRDVAWKARVESLPAEDLARLRQAVVEAARPYMDEASGRVRLVATSLCASGRVR